MNLDMATGFFIGFMVGGFLGALLAGLMQMASDQHENIARHTREDDEHEDLIK